MKKTKVKAKTSKKPSKSSQVEQQGLLDLVSAMTKIAERLEGLEKKMEQVIRQTAVGSSGMMSAGPNFQQFDRPHGSQEHRCEYQSSNQNQGPQLNNNRYERVMYQAVCADCRKDCEVPFKPTGERPIYCKECFVKRKATPQGIKATVGIPLHQQNLMKVLPEGMGKAAISGAVSASPQASSKPKSNKAGKKSRK